MQKKQLFNEQENTIQLMGCPSKLDHSKIASVRIGQLRRTTIYPSPFWTLIAVNSVHASSPTTANNLINVHFQLNISHPCLDFLSFFSSPHSSLPQVSHVDDKRRKYYCSDSSMLLMPSQRTCNQNDIRSILYILQFYLHHTLLAVACATCTSSALQNPCQNFE